jgi:1-hydroxycarotenoid 3,4-desaturase
MAHARAVIIGAGIGGLTAAALLAARGVEVVVAERAAAPGGKLRRIAIGDAGIDGGPTVFTMRWVLDEIFRAAGSSIETELRLTKADVLARHAWAPGRGQDQPSRLDLHADIARSADAIGHFAGARDADGYRRFCAEARRIYQTLEGPFIRSSRPSPPELVGRIGLGAARDIWRFQPFTTLWKELGRYFQDPRLRQLFGRYATYCGSSPCMPPATLMLVAHVEQDGVWLVDGGMHGIAIALAGVAGRQGATFRYGAHVDEILTEGGAAKGVRLANGEIIAADAVICNGDVSAVGGGLFGRAAARAAPIVAKADRSQSAITWATVARTDGFPLLRHSVFFSADYASEFDDVFRRNRPPSEPTVYVCAQDRDDRGVRTGTAAGGERLLCLINAPANGDCHRYSSEEIAQCATRTFRLLERCGLTVSRQSETTIATSPTDFDRMFPGTGGALYGASSHGWTATFKRAGARTRMPGLYLAGGSVHPGPGVPMAALSGRQAAHSLLADLASSRRSRPAVMRGGMSTA